MTADGLLDRAVVAQLFAVIGDDGARSVLELFVEESRDYVATIAAALTQPVAGYEQARRAAHSLKSAAGQVGAVALAAAALAVEQAAAAGAADLPELIGALRRSATATEAALRRLLAE